MQSLYIFSARDLGNFSRILESLSADQSDGFEWGLDPGGGWDLQKFGRPISASNL